MIEKLKNLFRTREQGVRLKKVPIESVFPDFSEATITLFHPTVTSTGCRLVELALFGYLAGSLDDVNIFEVGTSEGRTARNIAINLGDNGHLTTIDLMPDQHSSVDKMPDYQKSEGQLADAKFLSDLLPDIKNKVTLLHGDTTEYNFKEHHRKYDVIFVDGNHATDVILKDAQTAEMLLHTDGGIILFHDYLPDSMPTVVSAIHELNKKYQMLWLEGTKLAIAVLRTPRIRINHAHFGKK